MFERLRYQIETCGLRSVSLDDGMIHLPLKKWGYAYAPSLQASMIREEALRRMKPVIINTESASAIGI